MEPLETRLLLTGSESTFETPMDRPALAGGLVAENALTAPAETVDLDAIEVSCFKQAFFDGTTTTPFALAEFLDDLGLDAGDDGPDQAHRLPNVENVRVFGSLDRAHPMDLYQVLLDENTVGLEFEFRPMSGAGPVAGRMVLLDASGRTLCDAIPSENTPTLRLKVQILHVDQDSSLYLKVTAPPDLASPPIEPGSGSGFGSYALQVTRQDRPSAFSQTDGGGTTVPQAPPPSRPPAIQADRPAIALRSGAEMGGQGVVLVSSTIGSRPDTIPITSGPLPSRSASPLGGVLARGDPAPPVDLRDAVVVDLDLIHLPRRGAGEIPDELEEDATGGPGDGTSRPVGVLASVRGPGGFPLLAASLGGGRRSDSLASPMRTPWLAGSPTGPACLASAGGVGLEGRSSSPKERTRLYLNRGVSALGGLVMAFSLTFGLMLPDLATTFESVSSPEPRSRVKRPRRR